MPEIGVMGECRAGKPTLQASERHASIERSAQQRDGDVLIFTVDRPDKNLLVIVPLLLGKGIGFVTQNILSNVADDFQQAGNQEIKLLISVTTDADAAQIETIKSELAMYCPVAATCPRRYCCRPASGRWSRLPSRKYRAGFLPDCRRPHRL